MFTSQDYQKFAQECIEAARRSKGDERRKHYLDMAKMWSTVAATQPGADLVSIIPEIVNHQD